VLQIGQNLPSNAIQENNLSLSSSSQFDKAYKVHINGIEYKIAVNQNNKVNFISTSDPNFETEENFKIGTTYSEVKKSIASDVIKETGYSFKIKLASGWFACFTQGQTMTEDNLQNSSKIKWFQKL
jgi:hypothetical protein